MSSAPYSLRSFHVWNWAEWLTEPRFHLSLTKAATSPKTKKFLAASAPCRRVTRSWIAGRKRRFQVVRGMCPGRW